MISPEGSKLQFKAYDSNDCSGASSTYSFDKGFCYQSSSSNALYSLVEGTSPGTSPVTSPVTLPVTSPVTSPIKSPVTSPTSVGTLKGYVAKVFYSDTTCKTPYLATFKALGTCIYTSTNNYEYVTATSSTVYTNTYTDSQCKLGGSSESISYADRSCVGKTKIYVTSSTKFTASDANAVVR